MIYDSIANKPCLGLERGIEMGEKRVIFKKDFFNLAENKIFETAVGDTFAVVATLPRVPKAGKPSLVAEEVDVVPKGRALGTLVGALVLKVPSAPGTINLVFCWAGEKKITGERAIFTMSCLTDVLAACGEVDDKPLVREIVALLTQEKYASFGEDEAPILLNKLNRDYVDCCSDDDARGEVATGLMRVLLEATGLEAFPQNEPKQIFFRSPAGEKLFKLLTVVGNIKKSFDAMLEAESSDRRSFISIVVENSDVFGFSLADTESEEEFQAFLDYLLVMGFFGEEVDIKALNIGSLDLASSVVLSRLTGKAINVGSKPTNAEIAILKKRITETLAFVKLQGKDKAA